MRLLVVSVAVAAIATLSTAGVASAETLIGTPGPDRLIGTDHKDTLRGLGGVDMLRGQGGPDLIYGGAGRDDVFGGRGRDLIRAGPGDDWVRASAGRDGIRTQAGADTVQLGTSGPSRVWTGIGNDAVIAYDIDGNRDVVICGPGRDSVYYWGEPDPEDEYLGCERIADAAH